MKKFILCLFVICNIFIKTFGQKTILTIDKVVSKTDELLIHYSILNGDSVKLYYKINSESFCNGLAFISVEQKNSHIKGSYFPCEGKAQLDNISLNEENTMKLRSKQIFNSCLHVKIKRMTVKLKRGNKYRLHFAINYDNIVSNSGIDFYKERLVSNEISFVR